MVRSRYFILTCKDQWRKSSHSGIPWLRFIRQQLGERVRFWPFDGWDIPAGRSAIAKVYPALSSHGFDREGRTDDQHDAYSIAASALDHLNASESRVAANFNGLLQQNRPLPDGPSERSAKREREERSSLS